MSKLIFSRKKRPLYRIILPVAVLIFGLLCAAGVPRIVFTLTPKVNTIYPAKEKFTPNVQCSGTVEFAKLTNVVCDYPVVLESFNVIAGEQVEQGQIIATVNKSATIAKIKELYLKSPDSFIGGTLSENDIPQYIEAKERGVLFMSSPINELIPSGGTIAQIGDKSALIMRACVSERDIAKVDMGQSVEITTNADDNVYKGEVSSISSCARKQLNGSSEETVVDVVITIENPTESLKSGFTAEGKIKTGISATLLTIPYTAICQDSKSEYVYVFSSGYAKRRNITTGIELSDSAQVFGLKENDEVILPSEGISDSKPVIKNDSFAKEADFR